MGSMSSVVSSTKQARKTTRDKPLDSETSFEHMTFKVPLAP